MTSGVSDVMSGLLFIMFLYNVAFAAWRILVPGLRFTLTCVGLGAVLLCMTTACTYIGSSLFSPQRTVGHYIATGFTQTVLLSAALFVGVVYILCKVTLFLEEVVRPFCLSRKRRGTGLAGLLVPPSSDARYDLRNRTQ
jgi:hypothetical protein